MAIATYTRVKLFWGALDAIRADEPHTPAQTHGMGESAVPPGIGVRRAQLVFDRTAFTPPEDVVTTHLDIQNFTGGNPDDSWTDGDFSLIEAALRTCFVALAGMMAAPLKLNEIRWYRIGPGIVPPNPAVRITPENILATGSAKLPPQVALTLTLKSGVRASWGRMYLPFGTQSMVTPDGYILSSDASQIVSAFNTLFNTLAQSDFLPVVYSRTRSKAYSIEQLVVDDVWDVIRSRRFSKPTNRIESTEFAGADEG